MSQLDEALRRDFLSEKLDLTTAKDATTTISEFWHLSWHSSRQNILPCRPAVVRATTTHRNLQSSSLLWSRKRLRASLTRAGFPRLTSCEIS